MGFKMSLILGVLLVATVAGSAGYIKYLHEQLAIALGNQIVLESKIEEQNDSIDRYIENQKITQTKINMLEREKAEAGKEVKRLRKIFSEHDLDNLALNKPKLIENIINKGTQAAMDKLVNLSSPKYENTYNLPD
mgnify:FL=1|jgi:hypothetical protein|tara:strand:- start:3922 stop:4326 length:405 start_codon:yes stop_codon:yes gene_type:complete